MADPLHIYIGTYSSADAATADLDVVRGLYSDGVLRTYDAAVVTKKPDGKVHVHRHEHTVERAAWHGAAVGALVGVLFPPGLVVGTAVGAGAAGLVSHLWRGISRAQLKDLGEALDSGEANLVVISTSEIDHVFAGALKAVEHQIHRLDAADAKAFAAELENLGK